MAKLSKILGSAEDIETAFYDAINRSDLDALMALWVEDEEIVCIHPGSPRLVGHAAIRASWEAIFERGSLHIRPRSTHVSQNMLSSVHHVIEEVSHAGIEQLEGHVIATNVYFKTPMGWRLSSHHASVAPGIVEHDTKPGNTLH